MKQKTIELVNFLHQLVIKKKLLKSNQSMILAISGGQDSISLLFIFIQLKDQWNWKLSIIYCNHLWQKDSFYTMLHLFKLSYLLNLPLYLPVTLQKILTEQKARNWRSLTFQRITVFYLFSVIVTGHSKSDRIETGFFNLFRGSGTQGVGSLNWTKVKIKDYFFKLNKNHLKQICMNYPMLLKSNILTSKGYGREYPFKSSMLLKYSIRDITSLAYSMRSEKIKAAHTAFFPLEKKNAANLRKYQENHRIKGAHTASNSYNPSAMLLKAHKSSIRDTTSQGIQVKGYSNRKFEQQVKASEGSIPSREVCAALIPPLRIGYSNRRFEQKAAHTAGAALLFFSKRSFLRDTKQGHQVCLENKNAALSETKIKFLVIGLTSSVGKKQTKIACIPSHEEKMSTQIKIRTLPMPPYGANYIARGLIETKFLSQFYKNEYILVRPFLSLTRFDLKKICNSWKIPLFPDQSNQKLKYQRNRIRKQILPTLRFFFNPQIDTTIYQFIEIINSEQEYMDFITARIVNEIQFYQKQTIVELETAFINILPLPIRRKVIKQFLMRFVHKKNLKFFDVEQFLQQISMSCFLKEQKINEKKIKLFKKEKEKQKDFLVNIINQKQGKCKLYKLFFFPKTGSIFLQSQRVFFIKKLRQSS